VVPLSEKVAPAAVSASPRRVLNSDEYEAHTKARDIIDEARRKADEIKAEALKFKEEVFAKAKEEAKADLQARAAEELAKAKLQAGQIIADAEPQILELAVKIANRIIGVDLEREPEVVVDIVARVIETTRAAKAMTLRVHPEDGRLLRDKRPRLMELIGRSIDIAVKDDLEVERGGCIVQTDYGVLDGQLKTQFEMMRQLLLPDTSKKEKA
jgi:type III secretion protein L